MAVAGAVVVFVCAEFASLAAAFPGVMVRWLAERPARPARRPA